MGNDFLAQTHTVDVCIDFGGGDTLVPKHHLYDTQIGAAFEQMGGKGVAKGVGAHVLLYAHKRHKFLDVMEYRYAREGFLQAFTDEDIVLFMGILLRSTK